MEKNQEQIKFIKRNYSKFSLKKVFLLKASDSFKILPLGIVEKMNVLKLKLFQTIDCNMDLFKMTKKFTSDTLLMV